MSKASCKECGKSADARSMNICPACGNYLCGDCQRDHRVGCEEYA